MRCLLLFLLLGAGCSRSPEPPANDAPRESAGSPVPIEEIRRDAEQGRPASQRELAGRLLFGDGVATDPAAAVVWARRAALNGDAIAALWTGRSALSEPGGRVEAAAWFLVSKTGADEAASQDAAAELEALALSEAELGVAAKRAEELKETIRTNSKQSGDL
jgi:TPR repeat protein